MKKKKSCNTTYSQNSLWKLEWAKHRTRNWNSHELKLDSFKSPLEFFSAISSKERNQVKDLVNFCIPWKIGIHKIILDSGWQWIPRWRSFKTFVYLFIFPFFFFFCSCKFFLKQILPTKQHRLKKNTLHSIFVRVELKGFCVDQYFKNSIIIYID